MSNDKLQKQVSGGIKEKGQYVLAFGVIAAMLLVADFPFFVVVFFGIFAFFLWKMFAMPARNETRDIFEFYLAANDILRDDERRWFGFEIQEIINRGENILQTMNGVPPLVHFTLGALYHKVGDHKTAVNHLAFVVENENSDEAAFTNPTPELKSYVKVLRKIEREPAEAPLTSTAIRALERARRNRGKSLLAESRKFLDEQQEKIEAAALEREKKRAELTAQNNETNILQSVTNEAVEKHSQTLNQTPETIYPLFPKNGRSSESNEKKERKIENHKDEKIFADRKPISEVLHDIYDRNN